MFGLTALRKATPARPGLYYDAFFGLSVGLERFAKLAWLIDEWIATRAFPTNSDLRKQGHNILALINKAKAIRSNRKCASSVPTTYSILPSDPVTVSAVKFLSDFADATRYFNVDFLVGGRAKNMGDPIKVWHSLVGSSVLAMPGMKAKKARWLEQAAATAEAMRPAIVMATSASGAHLNNVVALLLSEQEAAEINKQAQWKMLGVVRFFGLLLIDLSEAANAAGHHFIPGLREHLGFFCDKDAIIRRYRRWPPADIT